MLRLLSTPQEIVFLDTNITFYLQSDVFRLLNCFKNLEERTDLEWNFLLECENNLALLLIDFSGLYSLLQQIDGTNRKLVLLILSEHLSQFITTSSELALVLQLLVENDDKIWLLRQIRSPGIKKIIYKYDNLLEIISTVDASIERYLFDLLGNDGLSALIQSLYQYSRSIQLIRVENREFMTQLIGIQFLSGLATNQQEKLQLLLSIPDSCVLELLQGGIQEYRDAYLYFSNIQNNPIVLSLIKKESLLI